MRQKVRQETDFWLPPSSAEYASVLVVFSALNLESFVGFLYFVKKLPNWSLKDRDWTKEELCTPMGANRKIRYIEKNAKPA